MLLVIGCGNILRSDDGVGPKVAQAVEALHLPGVHTLVCSRLTPELADPIGHAGTTVFVDAAVDEPRRLGIRRIEPGKPSVESAPESDPSSLLALARDAFGRVPEAWLLTVPAEALGRGDQLSPLAARGVRRAVAALQALHGNIRYRGHN